jgi:hypothetical protein
VQHRTVGVPWWSPTPHGDGRTFEGAPSANKGTTLDFWDLGRLVGRRWRIAVPMFVLAIVMTALIFTQVKPDYVATAYVQIVPPTPVAVAPGQQPRTQRNPWLTQSLATLGNAALVTIQDVGYVQSLKDKGFSDSYTEAMNDASPLITIQVTGKSMEQATGTADQLVDKFDASLNSLQAAYGVADVDLITARRLDGGTNVAESSSNVKRAVAAVGVVGLLLAVAVTIASDAWLRRRARAKTARAAAAASPPTAGPAPSAGPAQSTTPPVPQWLTDNGDSNALTMTRIFTVANGKGNGSGSAKDGRNPDRSADTRPIERYPAERASSDRAQAGRGPSDRAPNRASGNGRDLPDDVPADATVILPRATPVNDG